MPYLILVKHAMPHREPGVPSRAWRLGEPGRAGAAHLADRLAAYAPGVIAASAEPKATETARIVADRLGMETAVVPGLHENDRTGLGWLDAAAWEARIIRFFAEPGALVMGTETADTAHARFTAAVDGVCDAHPDETVVIVAHGTVITLYVSRETGIAPYPFWRRLGLPSFVVLSRPEKRVVAVVEGGEPESV